MAGIGREIIGLFRTLQELLIPDHVPDALNNILSRDLSHAIGLEPIVRSFLFLWIFWGFASLLIGIVGSVWVAIRSQSE